jgi:hypothetical protein
MQVVQSNIGFHPAAWSAAKKAAVDRRTSLSAIVNESVNAHLRLGLALDDSPAHGATAKKPRRR